MNGSSDQPTKPRRFRWKRLLQNLALAGATFLFCGIVLEIVLRVAGYGNLEIYQADPKLYWRLKPNQDCYTKVDRKPVHINSHGTRGDDFAAEKPPGTFRILSLGDSRTFGWGLSEDETYSDLLGKKLQARVEKVAPKGSTNSIERIEVINAGVNAWSFQQMEVFYRDIGAKWKPDVVVLAEANLWTQFSEQNSPEFVRQFMSRVRLKNFLRRFATYHYVVEVKLKDFYERHRTRFIPVEPQRDELFKEQQQADPDAAFRNAIEGLCRNALTNGAQPVLLFLPQMGELSVTNEPSVLGIKREVAAELGVPLVDATSRLADDGKTLYLDADPVHFNARGNMIVAEQLLESMTNHLIR